jgi:hypothetical protein
MQALVREMGQIIEKGAERLLGMTEAQSERRPTPDAWSAKEILGHLIDSAANNHRRFVEAQLTEELAFPGYEQERWVTVQRYQQASWPDLVELWRAYNRHLLHVVASIPNHMLQQKHHGHTLERIAWQPVNRETPVSLAYLIQDYYGHLQEHLEQIYNSAGEGQDHPIKGAKR